MSAEEILKPCPCCGGVAELYETEGCDCVISCDGCGLQILDDMRWEEKDYDARANVIEKWNTRGGIKPDASTEPSINYDGMLDAINCAVCGKELAEQEKEGGNCCDECWLRN